MKRSTRVLAFLLCFVMVAALMPAFALQAEAANAVTRHGEETINEPVVVLTEDRYGVLTGSSIPYENTYGTNIYYLFPHKDSGSPVTFTIVRNTTVGSGGDWNRWWRWAKEGDRAFTPSVPNSGSDKGTYDTTTPGVTGMDAWVVYREDGERDGKDMGDSVPVVKDGSREQQYIAAEVKKAYVYKWSGGNVTRARCCYVSIDPTLPFKTQSILWSSNGSEKDKLGNFLKTASLMSSRWVYNGTTDLAQNYFIIAEPRYITYDLNGGSIGTDTNDQSYMVWTSGTAKSSQKHKAIAAPTKDYCTFKGWYCEELGRIVQPGEDLNNGITKNMHLVAQWEDSRYYVKHVQNGTVVSTDIYFTDAKPTIDFTASVTSGFLYGGTFTDAACTSIATETPTNFTAVGGNTYYIWEVSAQHLQPVNLSIWYNTNDGTGNYDISDIFLITAIDRTLYKEAGFIVNGKEYKADAGNIAYDKIGIQLQKDGTVIPLTYFQMNPTANDTKNSKVVCCEITDYKANVAYTMQPYWVTADNVRVTGTNSRTFTYLGAGSTAAYKQLSISDYSAPSQVKSANSANSAPMTLMAMFSMSASNNPVSVDVESVITVVDGSYRYTVGTDTGSILGMIEPVGAEGKLFAGWYTDEACTVPADLEAVCDGDTVYARYISSSYLQVKFNSLFTAFNKNVTLISAVDSENYAETGFVVKTKNGTETVVVSSYESKYALQNAKDMFGSPVEKNAPLMVGEFSVANLSKGDTITVTPYCVAADGTTVYGTARTLAYNGFSIRG